MRFQTSLAVFMSLIVCQFSFAQTTWNSTSTSWGSTGSWSTGSVPTVTDTARFIPTGAAFGSVVNDPVLSSAFSAAALTLGPNQNFDGWNFTGNGSLTLGNTSPGALVPAHPESEFHPSAVNDKTGGLGINSETNVAWVSTGGGATRMDSVCRTSLRRSRAASNLRSRSAWMASRRPASTSCGET